MRVIRWATLVTAMAVAIGLFFSDSSTMSAEEKSSQKPVSVKQFAAVKVIGHLGYPLGTVVRITGICVDGDRARRRADVGKTLLEIRAVNGTPLKRPFVVPFERAAVEVTKPNDGDLFDFDAHEWGTFDGIVAVPKDLGIHKPMVANDGFHYRPKVTVHKSNMALPH